MPSIARDVLALAKRETPKIGGSVAGFIALVVLLVVIIVACCTAVVYLLRSDPDSDSDPATRGTNTRTRARRHARYPSSPSSAFYKPPHALVPSFTHAPDPAPSRTRLATLRSLFAGPHSHSDPGSGAGWVRTHHPQVSIASTASTTPFAARAFPYAHTHSPSSSPSHSPANTYSNFSPFHAHAHAHAHARAPITPPPMSRIASSSSLRFAVDLDADTDADLGRPMLLPSSSSASASALALLGAFPGVHVPERSARSYEPRCASPVSSDPDQDPDQDHAQDRDELRNFSTHSSVSVGGSRFFESL